VPHGGSAALILTALPVFGAGMGAAAVCGQIAALTGVAKRDSGLTDASFAVGTARGVAVCGSVAIAAEAGAAFAMAGVFPCVGLAAALTRLTRRTERRRERRRECAYSGV
jgi:predicted MFS family arabinose efflux permease